MGVVLGLYGDNGKENGNYSLGFRVSGLCMRLMEKKMETTI